MYSDDEVAACYDVLNPWGPGDDFYLALVTAAEAVLDVGCGPGGLLHRARREGHRGRLCGVDPDRAALRVARRRAPDVEWVAGTAASMTFEGEFDLAVMGGNAFQELVTDEDLRASLAAIRRAVVDGDRLAFDTRHLAARAWEGWHPGDAVDVVDPGGRPVRVWHEVEAVHGDVVTLTETTADQDGTVLRVDRGTLRFHTADTLATCLTDAGFTVEEQYGTWSGAPVTSASRMLVTIARAGEPERPVAGGQSVPGGAAGGSGSRSRSTASRRRRSGRRS